MHKLGSCYCNIQWHKRNLLIAWKVKVSYNYMLVLRGWCNLPSIGILPFLLENQYSCRNISPCSRESFKPPQPPEGMKQCRREKNAWKNDILVYTYVMVNSKTKIMSHVVKLYYILPAGYSNRIHVIFSKIWKPDPTLVKARKNLVWCHFYVVHARLNQWTFCMWNMPF